MINILKGLTLKDKWYEEHKFIFQLMILFFVNEYLKRLFIFLLLNRISPYFTNERSLNLRESTEFQTTKMGKDMLLNSKNFHKLKKLGPEKF